MAAIREPEAGERPEEEGQPCEGHRQPDSAWRRCIRVPLEASCGGGGYWLGHKAAYWWPKLAETEEEIRGRE